ncbi:MAG: ABC-type dipeptide/oligopeptide/nickel transport system, permease component [Acidimicrobiales bacterium]|nr:ABC-type dipeptide/oligopeptide/nickel transport system, permease component [Acidimicrobiales bacterium]
MTTVPPEVSPLGLTLEAAPHAAAESTATRKKGLGIASWLAIAWLTIMVGSAALADVLPLKDPNAGVAPKRFAPFQSGGPILGADANGRDMLSRTIYGGRISLIIAVCSILVGLFIGGFLGLLAGYFRNWLGNILVGLFDILLAIPQLVLALSLVSVLKGDPNIPEGFHLPIILVLIIALGLVSIPILARITRASTLSWSQRDFVTAARAQGAGHGRILFREVLPNVAPAMFSITLLGMAIAIVAEGGLAILGVSVEPPQSTWGTMIATGKSELDGAPFILWIPIAAVFLTAVSLNYLGDVIRDRFDVRESAL